MTVEEWLAETEESCSAREYFLKESNAETSLLLAALRAADGIEGKDTSEIFTHSSYYAQGFNQCLSEVRANIATALGVTEK